MGVGDAFTLLFGLLSLWRDREGGEDSTRGGGGARGVFELEVLVVDNMSRLSIILIVAVGEERVDDDDAEPEDVLLVVVIEV